ncbi:hypothetical protein [Streptomyces sp. NBC_00986]|nr:hypothetical protein OG504_07790 [Streptomyces sp. NBC_00986]
MLPQLLPGQGERGKGLAVVEGASLLIALDANAEAAATDTTSVAAAPRP